MKEDERDPNRMDVGRQYMQTAHYYLIVCVAVRFFFVAVCENIATIIYQGLEDQIGK